MLFMIAWGGGYLDTSRPKTWAGLLGNLAVKSLSLNRQVPRASGEIVEPRVQTASSSASRGGRLKQQTDLAL
jgi:hypothetical protein